MEHFQTTLSIGIIEKFLTNSKQQPEQNELRTSETSVLPELQTQQTKSVRFLDYLVY